MSEEKKYFGFRLKQRNDPVAVSFFVFPALPKDIIRWSTVDRLEEREGGVQRRISDARLRSIARFFVLETINVIPTSVVLAFPPGVSKFSPLSTEEFNADLMLCEGLIEECCQWGTLSFEFDPDKPLIERPAFVVDGQHRLFGMSRVENENLPILVSALIDAEPNEQAFQFIVINNKVTRVPSDLVRSLIVDFDEDSLQKRLETARVSLRAQALLVAIIDDEIESPLFEMIDWERRRGGGRPAVKPTAIEDSLKYIRRRFHVFDEDEDALIDFFFAMWHGVKNTYSVLWEQIKNHIFENAGFKTFSEYLTDEIETLVGIDYVDIYDKDSVTKAVETISGQIEVNFWQEEWKLKSLDTSAGREIVKDNLKLIRQNRKDRREWSTGLTLVGLQGET
jgi:DGQHR domain-containing protein